MVQKTRREFIRVSATTAAAAIAASATPFFGAEPKRSKAPGPKVSAWVTSKDRRFDPQSGLAWRKAVPNSSNTIQLDTTQRYQSILGFGAALTDASCYLLNGMEPAARKSLCSELFSSSGLGLSVSRTCIGASDYSTKAYSLDDSPEPDPDLKQFSTAHDREYILPMLRQVRKANPDLFLFSSPWSPPGWMKAGGSLLGGSMRKKYFEPYAQYFVRFLQDYAAEGVKINAITIQNEVDTDQDGRMPAALWGQEYEIGFVKNYLGPALERASLDTKIWILDHNYNLWGRAINELNDPGVNKYVDGVAWHGYAGTPDAMTRVHEAFPAKNMYWTEGGPDITSPDYATDWVKWSKNFAGSLRNWAECIVGWNFLLDEKGNPNIGPFPCGGVVTVNSKTGELTRSGQYWAFAHLSKAVQRSAHVISSQGDVPGVSHVAFENPDGHHVLVVSNEGAAQNATVQVTDLALDLLLEENSVTTLHW